METIDITPILNEYKRWENNISGSYNEHIILDNLMVNDSELYDSFYKEIKFGTSGLRGIMGLGPNRMNKYVVTRATRGLSEYLKTLKPQGANVLISYDTRNHSQEFAKITARVFLDMGIDAYIFKEPTPVPVLSYAIRSTKADLGIMITASHNPKIYNGYKVYNSDGHQIVGSQADDIMKEICKWDYFDLPDKKIKLKYVSNDISEQFMKSTMNSCDSILNDCSISYDKSLNIIYTPLNGTGRDYVMKALKLRGFENVHIVKSQEMYDGNFSTCPVPNPEKIAAYNEAFYTLDNEEADLIIATDPDCDRVGVAMCFDGVKRILTGNQIAILLFDFICNIKQNQSYNCNDISDDDINDNMLKKESKGVAMRSVVSTALFDKIAEAHDIEVVKTLTGFKYMGQFMSKMEEAGLIDNFIFAFEESNGYLFNSELRDKDGVGAAVLIAEMAAYYKSIGISLSERLDKIYDLYGQYHDKTKNYIFKGVEGSEIIDGIMSYFRFNIKGFLGGIEVLEKIDYLYDEGNLCDNIIEFKLRDHGILIIRPSGTEPKLKVYFFGNKDTRKIESEVNAIIDKFNNN
ncbi:MAG: phospho-sugar mutase [Clostridiales bacterium]|nr:phospho-sugar mutase [Clostridiales bacterium]MDY6116761.1 phospho-sugar mutase [Anaerovoracaceae bacterium]